MNAFNAQEFKCGILVVLLLNTRRRVKGHILVSTGTLDTILVHPREVFRPAIIGAAAAIVLMHCHPSGDPSPSEADIRVTRDLIRAGSCSRLKCSITLLSVQAKPSGLCVNWAIFTPEHRPKWNSK